MISSNQALDAVTEDVQTALGHLLVDGDGFSLARGFEEFSDQPLTNPDSTVVVVPWRWQGTNAGGLFDLEPTGRPVVVLGTTIVTEGEETLLLQRFVDWHDVMLQAGITAFPRPIVELRAAYGEADVREIDGMSEVLDKVDELRAGHFD